MKPRARRILAFVLLGSVTCAMGLAALAFFLVGTDAGARFVFSRAGGMLPGSLEARRIEGPLRGPLRVEGLVYRSGAFEVRAARAELDWNLSALLRGVLEVRYLAASDVTIRVARAPSASQQPLRLPDVNLPVRVVLGAAELRSLELRSVTTLDAPVDPATAPVRIDAVDLAARTAGDALRIERLEVSAPQLQLAVSGSVHPVGRYRLDLQHSFRYRPADGPSVAGHGSITGDFDRLRWRQELEPPLPAEIDVAIRGLPDAPRFEGFVRSPGIDPRQLVADAPPATVRGTVEIQGTLAKLDGEARLFLSSPEAGPERAPIAVTASGTLAWEEEPRFLLEARWRDLVLPLSGEPLLRSPEGRLAAAGTLASYAVRGVALASVGELRASTLRLAGRGGPGRLAIESFELAPDRGRIAGSGAVAWEPDVSFRLALRGDDLDPGLLQEGLEGTLSFTAHGEGRWHEDGPTGRLSDLRLEGSVERRPVLGRATLLAYAPGRYEVRDALLDWGRSRLVASGIAGERWDLEFSFDAPEVPLDGIQGELHLQGSVRGPGPTPTLAASFAGRSLAFGEHGAQSIAGDLRFDLSARGPVEARVTAERLLVVGRAFESATLSATGLLQDHELALALGDQARLVLAGALETEPSWGAARWHGELREAVLRFDAVGAFRLAGPAPLAASASALTLGATCLRSDASEICVEGTWEENESRLAASARDLPLALAQPLLPLPPELQLGGTFDGEVVLRRDEVATLVHARLHAGAGRVTREGQPPFRFERADFELDVDPRGTRADLGIRSSELGTLDLALALPQQRSLAPPGPTQAITGSLQARVPDLSFLSSLFPSLGPTTGSFASDLVVEGTVGAPEVSGTARLTNGAADVPRYGIVITELTLEARPTADGGVALEGAARSGSGRVRVEGRFGTLRSRGPFALRIEGQGFEAFDLPEARVIVSPDLELRSTGEALELTGTIRIPEARIETTTLAERPDVISPSPDVILEGVPEAPPEPEPVVMPALRAEIRLVAGDRVHVRAAGLEARLEGSLLLRQRPGGPTTAVGEIAILDGTYRTHGVTLPIESGRLVFAGGPIDDPIVDVRTRRTVGDVSAGFRITGTLQDFQVDTWSEPPMDGAEQLSYILLGRPLDAATPDDASLLSQAAVSLGVRGVDLLARKLAVRFGLDEARVETAAGPAGEASLFLGKYVSPRLYIGYGIGLLDATSVFRIRYLLTRSLTLRAEVGEATSADLLYGFERGPGAPSRAPGEEPARAVTVPAKEPE